MILFSSEKKLCGVLQLSRSTGERRVERGPKLVRPVSPYEVIAPKQMGIRLTASAGSRGSKFEECTKQRF